MNNTDNTSRPNLPQIAAAIARELPGSWSAAPVYSGENANQYLTRSGDGLKLFFAGSSGGWAAKGRLRVSFSRPRDKRGETVALYESAPRYGQISDPEISVAETKSPAEIAKDIARRLLPDAETVFAMAQKVIEERAEYHARKLAALQRVAEVTGNPLEKSRHTGEMRETFSFYHGETRLGDVQVNSATSIRATIDADSSARVAALVAFLKSPAYLGAE